MLTAAAEADDAFGADLFRLLAEDSAQTVFSPASVACALQMALCGARGETAAELARALHLDGPASAMDGLRLVTSLLGDVAARGLVTFRAPNTMWVQSGLALLPQFTAQLRDAAAVAVHDTDFARAPEAARSEINRVIAEQTAGKIADLLPPGSLDRMSRLVLANAVYLKAAWAQTFDEKATDDAPFYPDGPDHPGMTVRMMHGTAARSYLSRDGYQAVLLPYADARLAMAIVLPDGPLATLRPMIAADGLRGLLADATRHQVTLSLPKFRLEAQFDLIPALRQLGVRLAFTDEADFGGITDDDGTDGRDDRAQGLHRRERAGHRGGGGHRCGLLGRGRDAPAAEGDHDRRPALPVRDCRHADRPAAVPRPGQPPPSGMIGGSQSGWRSW